MMRKTAEKINTACVLGLYSGIGFLVIAAGFGGVGSTSDIKQSGDLRDAVENAVVNFEGHAASSGNEILDDPLSSFPIAKNNYHDDVTIKVTGNIKDGYCVIGSDSSIVQDSKKIIQYSSRDKKADQFGPDTCDIDITNPATVIEGTPEKEGMNWEDWATYLMGGGVGVAAVSCITGIAITTREEKYERNLPKSLISSSEPPKKSDEIDALSNASDEFSHLMAKVDNIRSVWSSYELDLVKLLDYPSVTDMSVRSTAEFHKAMKHVNYLSTLESVKSGAALGDFRKAVLDLDHKFDVMINEAKRKKWNGYNKKEKDSLRMAQNLLSIATNSASSMNERQVAYKRLMKELEGIIVVPEKAMAEIEAKALPALSPSDSQKEFTA